MKSESGEGEPVVEDDWSEGREDDCMNEEERVELFGQEELGVAGGEWRRGVAAVVWNLHRADNWKIMVIGNRASFITINGLHLAIFKSFFFFNPLLRRPTPHSMFDLKVLGSTTHKVHGSATPHKLYDAQLPSLFNPK